ncbi:MAG: hypothetical protein ABL888_14375 [Pirellulaceae bacterium]
MPANSTSESDILKLTGQILVLEPEGKWTTVIRKNPFTPLVPCERLLSVAELLEKAWKLPTIALISSNQEQLVELTGRLSPLLTRKTFACWLIGERLNDELTAWIERAGFCGVLTSLIEHSRWHNRAQRFFDAAPPVDWTLEQRIEHQYPWRSSLK